MNQCGGLFYDVAFNFAEMKAIANNNSIKDLIIWKIESLLSTRIAFHGAALQDVCPFSPLAKKVPMVHHSSLGCPGKQQRY